MTVTGLHILLTYQCNYECDHCFVFGSPRQAGTMTMNRISEVLEQAGETAAIEWIYFEGGEPFLFYSTLLNAVEAAARHGFKVGIVSNGYWATDLDDALACLRPFAGLVHDLSISSDQYHWNDLDSRQIRAATTAARELGIPVDLISIAPPEATHSRSSKGQIQAGESALVFRGRAAEQLSGRADWHSWKSFTSCPFEDFETPERVHLDPLGFVHACQGITIGNVFEEPLVQIFERYDPAAHEVIGPLVEGGPAALVRRHGLDCRDRYADACHLCFEARKVLRRSQPRLLAPDQMYGVS